LEAGLQEVDPQQGSGSSQPLRVVRNSKLEALPVALLPGLAPREPAWDLPGLDELPPGEGEMDQPEPRGGI
jgi:hypothetical protein